MKIILIILTIMIMLQLQRDIKKGYYAAYICMLALPVGANNLVYNMMDVIVFNNSYSINLYHLLLMIVPIWALKKIVVKKELLVTLKNPVIKLNLLLLAFYIIALYRGLGNTPTPYIEFFKYFAMSTWLISTLIIFKDEYDLDEFMHITTLGVNINLICILIINLFKTHFTFLIVEDARVSNAIQQQGTIVSLITSLTIVTTVYAVYKLLTYKLSIAERLNFIIAIITSAIYNVFIQSTRTVLILIIMLIIGVLGMHIFTNYKLTIKAKIGITIFTIVCAISFLFSNLDIAIRIRNIDLFSGNDSFATRYMTFKYYAEEIKQNIMGYGFGGNLKLVTAAGNFHGTDTQTFTDNAFINVGYKCGVYTMLSYFVLVLAPFYYGYKEFIDKPSTRKEVLVKFLTYICFIVATMLMTGQTTHSYQMMLFFGAYIPFITTGIKNKL